jgi:hypothetical protein
MHHKYCIDDFENDILHGTIFEVYVGQFPAAKYLAYIVTNKTDYNGYLSLMHQLLKNITLEFRKSNG